MTSPDVEPRDGATEPLDEALNRVERRQQEIGSVLPHWQLLAQLEAIDSGLTAERDSASLNRRIGPRRFLAIGALGVTSLSIIAGLLVHPLALATAAWKLRRLLYWDREWRPKVITLYADLAGVDGDVFEVVHELESTAVVVNFDALYERRFENAYGTVAPTAQEVRARLPQHAEAVDASLAFLVAREVLRSDGERYWITF